MHWSRAVRRVFVVGAVAALGTMFIAPAALSASTNDSNSTEGAGVAVPGWAAAKVSGEATGCHSEIELNIPSLQTGDASVKASDVSALDAGATQIGNLANALPDKAGYLKQLLQGAQGQINSAAVKAAEDGGEDAIFHQEAGPVPTVKLPWQGGGPVTNSEGDCTLDLFGFIEIPLAKDLKVSTVGAIGAAGYSHTEAESSDNFGLIYTADKVDTECLATLQDVEAKTDVSNGQYVDLVNNGGGNVSASLKDIPENPKKNDELTDFHFSTSLGGTPPAALNIDLSLTANEQDDNTNAVTVTGLHSAFKLTITVSGTTVLTLTVDGIRDQSHCDIDPVQTAAPITVEPKFTG